MSYRLTTACAFALGAACAIAPQAASAYVREVTSIGVPLAWKNPCVTMSLFLGDPPPVLTADQLLAAATTAASVWGQPALACSDIRLSIAANAEATADVGRDNKNVIVFRKDRWCASASASATGSCYPHSALAVTTLFKDKNTGEMVETDIAFNAFDYSWGDIVALPAVGTERTTDFQNALTHELGHVIGLDHSCYTGADSGPRLLDNNGSPAVDCLGAPPSITESTMYPSVSLKDSLRRDLAADDILGVCEIYPYSHDVCPDPAPTDPTPTQPTGGCSVVVGRATGDLAQSLAATAGCLAAVLILLYRSRGRRR